MFGARHRGSGDGAGLHGPRPRRAHPRRNGAAAASRMAQADLGSQPSLCRSRVCRRHHRLRTAAGSQSRSIAMPRTRRAAAHAAAARRLLCAAAGIDLRDLPGGRRSLRAAHRPAKTAARGSAATAAIPTRRVAGRSPLRSAMANSPGRTDAAARTAATCGRPGSRSFRGRRRRRRRLSSITMSAGTSSAPNRVAHRHARRRAAACCRRPAAAFEVSGPRRRCVFRATTTISSFSCATTGPT